MATDLAELVPVHSGLYLCRRCFKEYRVFRASQEQLRCKLCAGPLVEASDHAGYLLEAARRLLSKMQRQHQRPPQWMVNLLLSWVDAQPPKTTTRPRP